MPYAIDLFCGAGGMSEGLIQAGFHILFSSDINEQVKLTYKNRHEQLGLIHGYNTFYKQADIRELTGNFILKSIKNLEIFKDTNHNIPIDVIFGGPPCQGFSLAGKRALDDPRNILFKEYLRIVNDIRPKYVVMENVEGFMTTSLKNFTGLRNKKYKGTQPITNILLKEFNNIGYKVLPPTLLDASDYGVPQRRNRAIFIAYLPEYPKPEYPKPLFLKHEKVTILEAIGDLISDPIKSKKYNLEPSTYQLDSKYGRTLKIDKSPIQYDNNIHNYDFSKHEKHIIERFSLYKIGEDTSTLRKRIQNKGISLKNKPHLLKLLLQKYSHKYTEDDILKIFKNCKNYWKKKGSKGREWGSSWTVVM